MSTAAEKQQGHVAHSKASDNQLGLQGTMPRPIVITMMGAGSGFTPTLMKDVLCIPSAEAGEIRLCDVDDNRLATMHKVITKLVEASGRTGWTVKASKN